MRLNFDRAISLVIALSAVAAASAFVHREFLRSPSEQPASGGPRPPTRVRGWENIVALGLPISRNQAPIVIAELGDFECPSCRSFAAALDEALAVLRDSASAVFVHYPLSYHRFARPAARAAECADRMGTFSALYALLYQKQDSLGLKSWTSYAREAGISDTAAFVACMQEANEPARIQRGIEEGKRIAVAGTPTILINGWRLLSTPTADELVRMVRAIAAGDTLFGAQD